MDNKKTHIHHGIKFLFITIFLLIICANAFALSESITDPNIQKTITVRHIDPNIAAKVVEQIIKLKIFQLPKETLVVPNQQGKMLTAMTETTGQMKLIEEIVENIDFQITNEGAINKINIPVTNLIFDEFHRIISPLLSKEGRLSYNITAHTLVVTEITENLNNIENFVTKLDSYDFVDPNSIPDTGVIDIPKQADTNSTETKAADSNDPMVAVQFSGFKIEQITDRLKQWTGKEVVPSQEAMNIRLTVYSPEKMKRSEAIKLLYSAIRYQGFIAEETDDVIYIKFSPFSPRMDILSQDDPLENIPDKDKVVRKIFNLKNTSPSIMGQLILPYLSSSGHFTADESTKTLMVGDTVKNLIQIEHRIEIFDSDPNALPKGGVIYPVDPNEEIAEPNISKNFQLKYLKPSKMKQILEPLISKNGHIDANDETKILLIDDDPKTLKRLENIIEFFDIEHSSIYNAGGIFVDPNVDPREIINIINLILKDQKDPNSPRHTNTTRKTARNRVDANSVEIQTEDSNQVSLTPAYQDSHIANFIKDAIVNLSKRTQNFILPNFILEVAKQKKEMSEWEAQTNIELLELEEARKLGFDMIKLKNIDFEQAVLKANEVLAILGINPNDRISFVAPEREKRIYIAGNKEDTKLVKNLIANIDYQATNNAFEFEFFQIKYVDFNELFKIMQSIVNDSELLIPFNIYPITHSKQILVFGSKYYRDNFRKIIKEAEGPLKEQPEGNGTQRQESEAVYVKYVDADIGAEKLKELLKEIEIDLTNRLIILPLATSKQILVFGNNEKDRELAESLIHDIDYQAAENSYDFENIQLKHIEPEAFSDFVTKTIEEYRNLKLNLYPIITSKQILIFGGKEYRNVVRKFAEKIDFQTSRLGTEDPNSPSLTTASDVFLKIFEIHNWNSVELAEMLNAIIKNKINKESFSNLEADPITLIPWPESNWIIVRASDDSITFIAEWIKILESEYPDKIKNVSLFEIDDPNQSEPLVAIQSSGLTINGIKEALTEWTGKKVIDSEEAKNLSIIVFAAEKMTRSNAAKLLYAAIRYQGFIVEETEDSIYIKKREDLLNSRHSNWTDFDRIQIIFADMEELIVNIRTILRGSDINFTQNVSFKPLIELKQILVSGDKKYKDIIKKIIVTIDKPSFVEAQEYEFIPIKHVDFNELTSTMYSILDDSKIDYHNKISIVPLTELKTLIIYGDKNYCELIRKMVDVPSEQSQLIRKSFQLEHANPRDVQNKLNELFGDPNTHNNSNSRTISEDAVITTIYPSLNQIVILAPEEKMKEIEKIIREWDSPIDFKMS